MNPTCRLGWIVLALSLLSSCTIDSAQEAVDDARHGVPAHNDPHELLNATLWVQHAAEYTALAHQAFNVARQRLDRALRDPHWTAALEQEDGYETLPPAIVVDVDDTVLDNSCYEARLIRDRAYYAAASWDPWVREQSAPPVPGALEFCADAHRRGVTVFYVTNRRSHLREPTRRHLERLGFPLRSDLETVLTRSDASDKGPRRAGITRAFRVLLAVGDNNGDFASAFVSDSSRRRRAVADEYADYWGNRWIVLPNPMYGGWETAIVKDWESSADERLARKIRALRFDPPASRP